MVELGPFEVKQSGVMKSPSNNKTARRVATRELPTEQRDLELGVLTGFVGYQLRLTQTAAFAHFERSLARHELSPGRFGLLMLIAQNPGLTQSRLAEAIQLDRSSMVPILDRLQAEGLVERRDSPSDRRSYEVLITVKGRNLLDRALPLVQQHEERIVQGLSKAERTELLDMLRRIAENARSS